MHVGNLPERYDVALDLTGLTATLVHEPGDLTLVAGAGIRVADISAVLAKSRQRLPFDVPEPERATIGGSVASNAAGVMRSSTGALRDWVIGMKVVMADGTVTKSGGRVVKNVQGYDMHRLHTGAFGTLGVIAEVAFKLTPIPESSTTVAACFANTEIASTAAAAIFNGYVSPEAWSLFTGEGAKSTAMRLVPLAREFKTTHLLLAKVAGGRAAVNRQVSDLVSAARNAGAYGVEVVDQADEARTWKDAASAPLEAVVSARLSVLPADACKAMVDIEAATARWPALRSWTRTDCGFGTVMAHWWAKNDEDAREAITASTRAATRHGGSAVIEKCPAGLKRGMDMFGDVGPSISIMRRMKAQYDPDRNLNPGRFAGGI